MKTRVLTFLFAAAVAVAACQSSRQAPPPSTPPPTGPGPGTAAPPPNPNPEPPKPPVATPVAVIAPASAPPAAAIPDQPVIATGTAPAARPARPHQDILKLKQEGLSDEFILNKIRTDNVNYQLTTADIIELRGAGLSETLLEAMLRSGQPAVR